MSGVNIWDIVEPEILVVAASLYLLYLCIVVIFRKPLFHDAPPPTSKQLSQFGLGCLVLYLSFGGPLDFLSDNYLFSVHMVQHMVEIIVMTPLFIRGVPKWLTDYAMKWYPFRRVVQTWLHPVASTVVFIGVLNLFHMPALYDLALRNDPFHFFEHTCFFIVAIFFWLSYARLSLGKRLLYLLLNYNLTMPLVIFMLIANHPWYTYYVTKPRLAAWLTPLADQQMGALVMAIMMMGAFAVLGLRDYVRQDEGLWYA